MLRSPCSTCKRLVGRRDVFGCGSGQRPRVYLPCEGSPAVQEKRLSASTKGHLEPSYINAVEKSYTSERLVGLDLWYIRYDTIGRGQCGLQYVSIPRLHRYFHPHCSSSTHPSSLWCSPTRSRFYYSPQPAALSQTLLAAMLGGYRLGSVGDMVVKMCKTTGAR